MALDLVFQVLSLLGLFAFENRGSAVEVFVWYFGVVGTWAWERLGSEFGVVCGRRKVGTWALRMLRDEGVVGAVGCGVVAHILPRWRRSTFCSFAFSEPFGLTNESSKAFGVEIQ